MYISEMKSGQSEGRRTGMRSEEEGRVRKRKGEKVWECGGY